MKVGASPSVLFSLFCLCTIFSLIQLVQTSEPCTCNCCSRGVCELSANQNFTVDSCDLCTSESCRYRHQCEDSQYVLASCVASDTIWDRFVVFSLIGLIFLMFIGALLINKVLFLRVLFNVEKSSSADPKPKPTSRSTIMVDEEIEIGKVN
eukprot:TRINITY_DN1438_c0_g1_i1.p1 TRINITY_DN1438_c0_g1~~TRINITY_DN1438_c0_g1_i1.p1  ORF type:complete len:167 (+),score=36.16 TRINITY_DN1438_c0_g1_i1:50-502(+)